MPLVEDNIDTHDEHLTRIFWDSFSHQKSGEIVDDDKNSWVIFHEDEFNMLIYHYESIISSPIGIWIGFSVAFTSAPRLRPSDESIAMVLTMFSPM